MAATLACPIIYVGGGEKVCINCKHYAQYYRHRERGEYAIIPSTSGFCHLHDKERGPLRQPCKDYETQ